MNSQRLVWVRELVRKRPICDFNVMKDELNRIFRYYALLDTQT